MGDRRVGGAHLPPPPLSSGPNSPQDHCGLGQLGVGDDLALSTGPSISYPGPLLLGVLRKQILPRTECWILVPSRVYEAARE